MRNLIQKHVSANLGIYFDTDSQISDAMHYASSSQIRDYYWNFAYRWDERHVSETEAAVVRESAQAQDRTPAAWGRHGTELPTGWRVASTETWMIARFDGIRDGDTPADISISIADHVTDEMVDVFNDAYSSGGDPTSVGYFELPMEYGEAFRGTSPQSPARAILVRADEGGTCVGIATLVILGDFAGLYSVATRRSHRRSGVGRAVSGAALREGRAMGAQHCFLQTEPDSPVEEMYQSLGFKRAFLGELIIPD